MNHQDSAFVLSALLDATDPSTGQPLTDPLFLRRDIKAALTCARQALTHKAQLHRPANAGKPWTDQQDRDLAAAFTKGSSIPAMATQHKRSVAAIEARLIHQGLIKREDASSKIRF